MLQKFVIGLQQKLRVKNSNALLFLYFIVCFPPLANGFYKYELVNHPTLFWIQDLIFALLLPLYGIYLILNNKLLSWDDLGLSITDKNVLKLFGLTLLITYLTYNYFYYSEYIMFTLFPMDLRFHNFNYGMVMPSEHLAKFLTAFYMAITAGFFEEVYHRSIAYKICIANKKSNSFYVLASSIMFTLMHWESGPQFIFIVLIYAILNAIIFLKIKNIWPLIGAHFVYDFIVFVGI